MKWIIVIDETPRSKKKTFFVCKQISETEYEVWAVYKEEQAARESVHNHNIQNQLANVTP